MPLLRYFIYVGGALVALLLVVSACFPQAEAVASRDVASHDVARPVIRIKSDRVAPPRVDLDTSQPTAVVPNLLPWQAQAPARDALAQLAAPLPAPAAVPVKIEQKKTKITKRPDRQRLAAYPQGFQPLQSTW